MTAGNDRLLPDQPVSIRSPRQRAYLAALEARGPMTAERVAEVAGYPCPTHSIESHKRVLKALVVKGLACGPDPDHGYWEAVQAEEVN